jgi:hypothetical protein
LPVIGGDMSQTRTSLNSVLLGDELGQIKLVSLDPKHVNHIDPHGPRRFGAKSGSPTFEKYPVDTVSCDNDPYDDGDDDDDHRRDQYSPRRDGYDSKTLGSLQQRHKSLQHRHKIIKIYSASCLQREPAASRAITNIRPIQNIYESDLDTTDKPNSLFLITNKVGQIFVCDTDIVRTKLRHCLDLETRLANGELYQFNGTDHYVCDDDEKSTILSPVYYNMNNKVQVFGAQPINQTNILVVYKNGDIQHVNIGQDILQSSLKIKRKAIRMLGLGYNSDARAVHWRIDGATGICYFDSDATSAHMNENDPLTDIVLSSPTHKLNKRRTDKTDQDIYSKSPCIKSRKHNEQDLLVPTQVINMITSRADQYKPSLRIGKWSSITSLNLIYRKLALYDLVGSENFKYGYSDGGHGINAFKLNDNRLAVGGSKYALRVYDVQTQKPIYNCLTGSNKGPLVCPAKGEPIMIGDIDWLGGNKTTRKSPDMLATCSGVDSVVRVYDLRSVKPAFYMDLTNQTESKWQAYKNYHRGCMFTSICASGAPYSTAVPSQQLALGSTNGQLHLIDLRFVAKSNRTLGKLSGFCGGSIREIRFVSESFETSKMISCASDRFVRIHRIQTSYTSVISQKLATKVFLGTRPTCVQPVCDEISQQSYLASLVSRYGSESHISTNDSNSWSLL